MAGKYSLRPNEILNEESYNFLGEYILWYPLIEWNADMGYPEALFLFH